MFEFFQPIVDAWRGHLYGSVALGVLVAVVNVLLRLKTPAEWVEFADMYPRVHALFALMRAVGVQPVEALNALRRLVTGEKPPVVLTLPRPTNDTGDA